MNGDDTDNRTLLIGYGNPFRRDDGVAFHIINMVRSQLNRPPLSPDDTGEDNLGHAVDTVMAHQLAPEMAPLVGQYGRVVFIDAHTGAIPASLRVAPVVEEGTFQAVTHHLSPGLLLSFVRAACGHVPESHLVSVRGYDFDFGEELTEECREHAVEAAERVCSLTPAPFPTPGRANH